MSTEPEAKPETAALSLDDAVAALDLDKPAEAPEAEAEESEPEAVEAEPAESAEEDTVEPEEAEAADEEPEAEASEEPQHLELADFGELTIPITVDGKVTKVSLAEAAQGYQREADYTRKTQALAEQRKALDAERTQAEEALQKQQQEIVSLYAEIVGEPPEPSMAEDDPYEYTRLKAAYDARLEKFQAKQQEVAQKEADARNRIGQKEADRLLEKAPEFRDQKFFQGLVGKLGEAYGVSPQEVAETMDHRIFLMARDAMRYRESLKTPAAVEKALKKPAKVIKPGAAKTQSEREAANRAALKRKLSKPHTIQEHLKAFGFD